MALVKCQRNSPNTVEVSEDETEDDEALSKSEKSECFFARKGTALVLTLKDAVPLAAGSERRLSTESLRSTNSTQSNNSDIHLHLQSMFNLLRNEETLKMAVKLESQRPNRTRYIVIASRCCYRRPSGNQLTGERRSKILRNNSMRTTTDRTSATGNNLTAMRQLSMDSNSNNNNNNNIGRLQPLQTAALPAPTVNANFDILSTSLPTATTAAGMSTCLRQSLRCDGDHNTAKATIDICCSDDAGTEESCILGIDCNEHTTIGLVVPILADTTIRLDGDGGFSVSVYNKTHIFKPVSVQAMWSALQTLHKVSKKARENNFYPGGPSHDWLNYYESRIESDQSCLNEWNAMDSLESKRPPSPDAIRNKPTAKEETESIIKMKLKEIMMSVDLDEVTSKYIRGRLEEHLDMDLGEYKSFIDQEMLTILGQMDAPTEIFEHVYLGSEWNASNLEELQKNGVRHILNVTREIDNFFPGMFDYLNVRVYDDEKTNLLKYWDNTFRYITAAKAEGSKVLVHCKMGVSRSASVVIAYAMKAYNWEFQEALQHVKQRRSCIKPNKNFLNQLETYRGMLDAMKNKEKLQRSKSETNLKSTKDARLLPGSEPTPLIQALNQSKTKLNSSATHERGVTITSVGGSVGIVVGESVDLVGAPLSVNVNVVSGAASDTSMFSTSQQQHRAARQRGIRRSSSTSPKGSCGGSHGTIVVCKQQSQSLENLTPERSAADEPKNVRVPGSNGENYSVTQNRVMHIQKNTPPPPPPPLPPPLSSALTPTSQQQQQKQATSVRNIVHGLEAVVGGVIVGTERKTADDRKSLNLPFKRSVSHETNNINMQTNTTTTTKVYNFDALTGSLRSSLRGLPHSSSTARSRRKTQSWAASSGGIVIDPKLGSNSSIDSSSSCQSQASTQTMPPSNAAVAPTFCDFNAPRRESLPRHASWGSGDNRYRAFNVNTYDSNRNHATNSPIIEGRPHELNIMSNKTAIINTTTSSASSINNSSQQQQHHHSQQHQQQLGTVNRTKQKLEESTQFKKRRQDSNETDSDVLRGTASGILVKRNSNLCRSSSSAAPSARFRFPLRCNSDEIIAAAPTAASLAMQYSPGVMRRSEGSRPTQHQLVAAAELYDSTTLGTTTLTTTFSVCDIANKNLPPANIENERVSVMPDVADDEAESGVEMRHLTPATTTTEEQQRISGNVQILKKNFEAKAGAPVSQSQTTGATTTTPSTLTTNAINESEEQPKKGHQSLPASPLAQHNEQQQFLQQQKTENLKQTSNTSSNVGGSSGGGVGGQFNTSSSSSSSSSSACSSSSSVSESCDRNVKGLVHKYQKTKATTKSTITSNDNASSIISNKNISNTLHNATSTTTTTQTTISTYKLANRPRSCYEQTHHQNQQQRRQQEKTTATFSSSTIGQVHEFNDGRPPPSPAKFNQNLTAQQSQPHIQTQPITQNQQPTNSNNETDNSNIQQQPQQQQQQLQYRRLQQHGKTHPLARLSLQKHNLNAAAYNTIFVRMLRTVSYSLENADDDTKIKLNNIEIDSRGSHSK